jgi:hypothetical protein
MNMTCAGGSPSPPEKDSWSIPPFELQVELAKTLFGSDVGQSNVNPSRPVNVRSRLVKVSNVALNTIRHPAGEGSEIGGFARAHVAELNVTANGAAGSAMKHSAGLAIQIFTGSRTCTWKLTPTARAWLVNPQNRARINKTRRRYFIRIPPKIGRAGAETVDAELRFGRI